MMMNPIDRPFRSREDRESEQALVAQYRELGNRELLESQTSDGHSDQATDAGR